MPFFSPKGEPLENPYELLNLDHGATDDDIAKSFKKLMLQLHPDKQPAGQSAEEAEQVARKLYDVMDAKTFLLDGEHLASRRAYDSRLVRAKQPQPFLPPKQQSTSAMPFVPKKDSFEGKKSHAVSSKGGNKQPFKPKSAFHAKKKVHVNVTQWGNVNRNRVRSTSTPRRSSEVDNKKDPMKNKTHNRARGKALNDSCGDCSTTDDASSTSDDELKRRRHTYVAGAAGYNANNNARPSSNRPPSKGRQKIPTGEPAPRNNNNIKRNSCHQPANNAALRRSNTDSGKGADDASKRRNETRKKSSPEVGNSAAQPKKGYKPADAAKAADFSTFYPAMDTLEKQYQCPLTKEVMKEPMSDFEGNSYERTAILKYLETHSTSPVTGNSLYAMHLTPNSALKEKILYTLKLKDCLDSLQNAKILPRDCRYKSLPDAVNTFIKDLNSGAPSITITQLDDSGSTSFSFMGLKFRLEVPEGINDNIIVQTWFDHRNKSAGIASRVVKFNATLQKMGLGGKLTFRNMSGKHAFTLSKAIDPEKFSKTLLRHCIEYFMEMSIKLHNIIDPTNMKQVDKVRLTSVAF